MVSFFGAQVPQTSFFTIPNERAISQGGCEQARRGDGIGLRKTTYTLQDSQHDILIRLSVSQVRWRIYAQSCACKQAKAHARTRTRPRTRARTRTRESTRARRHVRASRGDIPKCRAFAKVDVGLCTPPHTFANSQCQPA